MAKKTLTPEQAEIKAMKKVKSSQNWTKFWAVVLAAALTLGVVGLGKAQADKAVEKAGNTNNVVDNDNTNTPADDDNMFDDDNAFNNDDSSNNDASNDDASNNDASNNDASNNDASNNNSSSNNNASSNNNTSNNNSSSNNNAPAKQTLADALKAVNDATAKAAKASYNWKRTGEFTKDIDLGSSTATNAVNAVITSVDPNATLNSVVGGFIGVGNKENTVTNGKPGEGMDEKYLLKATTLQESDIQSWKVDGNKYMLQIKNCQTPKAGSAMDHATNDYITVEEINTTISGFTSAISVKDSSSANYTKIVLVATIENGQLTNMNLSYAFDAKLDLKLAIVSATGTGAAKIEATYSNFKY